MSATAAPDWREVLRPGGRWSALVVTGSGPAQAARCATGLAYLALPYAGEVALRHSWRMERSVRLQAEAAMAAAALMREGCHVICPVLQRASIAAVAGLAGLEVDLLDDPVWTQMACALRNGVRLMVVPDVRGWDRCPAIWGDVTWALDRNMPVHLYAGGAG
jgi:hypothetical protein